MTDLRFLSFGRKKRKVSKHLRAIGRQYQVMEKEKRRRADLLSNSVKAGHNGMRREKLEGEGPHLDKSGPQKAH